MSHSKFRLETYTREEIAAFATEACVIIPVGAIEQHGYHLPLNTDSVIADGIVSEICSQLQKEFVTIMTPTLVYGNSHHHFPYPALSLTSETLIVVLKDLVRCLARIGFKNLFILNSHGGNEEAIRIVARDMARECQVSIAATSYWTVSWEALQSECHANNVGRVPGHAGSFETSLMLWLQPELVHLERRPEQREDVIPKEEMARRIYIQRPNNSVGVDGISDDSRHASREKGKQFFDVIVREVSRTVRQFMMVNPKQ